MNQWYLTTVKFTKEFTDGTLKRVTENYMFNAMSFTEAEARVYKEVGEYVRGEFHVKGIVPKQVNDIWNYEDCDEWWDAKVDCVMEDADTGKEKKLSYNFLVTASSLREANDRVVAELKGVMAKMRVVGISKSKVIEIFHYESTDEEDGEESESKESKEEINSPNINVAYVADEEE